MSHEVTSTLPIMTNPRNRRRGGGPVARPVAGAAARPAAVGLQQRQALLGALAFDRLIGCRLDRR